MTNCPFSEVNKQEAEILLAGRIFASKKIKLRMVLSWNEN